MSSSSTNTKQKVRNERVFKLLEVVVSSFMHALDKPFLLDYGSWYDRIKTLVEANSSLVAEILLKRPDLEDEKLSRCLLGTEKYLESITKEDVSSTPPHASTREDYREELVHFLDKLFMEKERVQRRGTFSEEGLRRHFNDILRREYSGYEDYLYSESVSDFVICPLDNFVGSKELDFGLSKIRKIAQDEFHSLVEAEERHGSKLESYPEFVLCLPSNDDWRTVAEMIITALRLLDKERVGLSRAYNGYALPCRMWEILEPPAESKFVKKHADSLYVLPDSEDEKLIDLFSILNETKNVGYLTTAIRRFNFAYARDRYEDRWIDYFVSLESLYSKTSESGEVTHKIATRVSKALADSFEERTKMVRRMRKWYGIRSKIVHGIRVSIDQKQIQELEEIVRKSLKWFMNQKEHANHQEIIDILDLGT